MKKAYLSLILLTVAVSAVAQWKPAGDNIMSAWAEDVNPAAVHQEYPRPQMVREQWMNLNGLWDYAITPCGSKDFVAEGKILVPFAVESALSGVGRRVDEGNELWYERTFSIPSSWKGRDVLLHFGAVDWKTDVWVNGYYVGEHKGGYDPFSFNVTPYLRNSGSQTLRVKVYDATDQSFQPRGKQVKVPGLIWYTPVTGIWQTVWMEPVAKSHIENYYVVSDLEAGTMTVNVDVAALHVDDLVKVEVMEGGEGYSAENPSQTVLAEAVVENGKAIVKVDDVKTWSPDSPYLYGVKVWVERNGKVVDSVNGYTAMRKISIKQDSTLNKYNRMALNNELLFHFGPLDQGWWPDGLYTAPTDEALEFDVIKTKEHGFNMIRKHIKLEPARWYYYCDLHGIMVWQDMPCIGDHSKTVMPARDEDVKKAVSNKWSSDSIFGGTDCDIPQEWKDNYYREWADILNAFKNFQCIVVWVPFNEAWGQFDTPAVVKFTREIDPTRLINPASGGNFDFSAGVKEFGDILDVHHYPCPAMNVFERKFVNVLGEYGGIGMPVEGHTWIIDRKWGYGKVKENSEELMKQYEEYLEMLKTFVATGCAAAVYTQTTDVEGEVNGLMTYDRKVIKMDVPRIAAANRKVIESMSK